jgi:hypothetical protein
MFLDPTPQPVDKPTDKAPGVASRDDSRRSERGMWSATIDLAQVMPGP